MGYTTFKNGSQPALSDTVLNQMQVGLMQLVFPIGSTYITQNTTNPNAILGFGTWERLKGKVCLGLDEDDADLKTIGKTGGEKVHKLTTSEIPSHQHTINYDTRNSASSFASSSSLGLVSGGTVKETNLKTSSIGDGYAHNNMQPYEVVGYMWIRRS